MLTNAVTFSIILKQAQERQRKREWRNRQTRTFEGRVVNTVRVQVPFLAPKILVLRNKDFLTLDKRDIVLEFCNRLW